MHCTQLSLIYLCPAAHQWKPLLLPFLLICYRLPRSRSEFAREEWPVILSCCSLSKFYSSFPLTLHSLIRVCWYGLVSPHLPVLWPYSDWLLILLSPVETDFAGLGAMCSLFSAFHFWYATIPALVGGEWWQPPCSALASPSSYSPAAPLPLLWQLVWKLFLLYYQCGEWTFNFICVCIKSEELRAGRDLHRSSASCSEDQLYLYHSCYVNLIFSKRALIMELPDLLQIIYFSSCHPYIFQISSLSPLLLQDVLDSHFLTYPA